MHLSPVCAHVHIRRDTYCYCRTALSTSENWCRGGSPTRESSNRPVWKRGSLHSGEPTLIFTWISVSKMFTASHTTSHPSTNRPSYGHVLPKSASASGRGAQDDETINVNDWAAISKTLRGATLHSVDASRESPGVIARNYKTSRSPSRSPSRDGANADRAEEAGDCITIPNILLFPNLLKCIREESL